MNNAYNFFEQAPVIIGYVRGHDYVIEFANEALLAVWKVKSDVLGKSLFEVFPELEDQGFRKLLDEVRTTGVPFNAYEFPILFERGEQSATHYFDFIYKPYFEANSIVGVIAVGHDVTERVLAKKRAEREEKKWKQLANSVPVIFWTADEKGNANFFNELWYQTTGLSSEQTLGFGWTNAIHPEDKKRCMDAWTNALVTHTLYEVEARYKKYDGSYQWMLAKGIPIFEDDIVISWYGTSTDITGQKNIEQGLEELIKARTVEVEEKSRLLDNILKHSTNGISVSRAIFDNGGDVIDAQTVIASDSAINFVGLPKELYLTKPATHFDPNIIASPYGQACIKTLRTGEPFIMRYYLDFNKRWLELTVSKMDDSHLIHLFTDVTSIREAELRLEETLNELRYSNANLEAFAYAASHDLKEPIRKAQYFANRLGETIKAKLQPSEQVVLDRLKNSHERMFKLIDDLLEYSQAAQGTAEKKDIDLNDVLRQVIEDLELEIQKRSAKITVQSLPIVAGNSRQIHQMFQNLISNALKYVDTATVPEIEITSRELQRQELQERIPSDFHGKKFHLIRVADNGIGFDQKYAVDIFKVFTRLHANEQYRGSGIGLSIVKKVVESHNGLIWAESQPLKGSVFNILLPAERRES